MQTYCAKICACKCQCANFGFGCIDRRGRWDGLQSGTGDDTTVGAGMLRILRGSLA